MKKIKVKIIAIIFAILMIFCLIGCNNQKPKISERETEKVFVLVGYAEAEYKIVYHRKTRVMYVVSCGSYNYGTFTVMVDENGKPLLWQGE